MACGCGGECCKQQVKGLGFLYTGDPDYWYIEGGDQSPDWDALWYESVWGIPYDYWTNYSGPIYDSDFIDRQQSERGGAGLNLNWQSLIDWWRDFTGGYTGPQPVPSGGGIDSERGLPGYCPPGYYHPISDPYSCVPFPNETPQERNQRQIAQRQAQQQAAQRAAQQRAQQAAQPCPPNTGLVKNRQGQCVCPPGQAFSRSQGKCVLVSQLTEADKKALEGSDLWKYLAIGAFALIAIKAVK